MSNRIRSALVLVAMLAFALAGCVSPPQLRESRPAFVIEGPGERVKVSMCLVNRVETVLPGMQATLRSDPTPGGVTEIPILGENCAGACAVIDVRDAAPGAVQATAWAAGDLIFRGTFIKMLRRAVEDCVKPLAAPPPR